MAMFNHNGFVLAILIVVLIPATTIATQYMVGDDCGWTTGVDYQAWAKDKVFKVNDTLEFIYPKDTHNVYAVDSVAFDACSIDRPNYYFDTGDDVLIFDAAGTYYFICGVLGHCSDSNQKFSVDVVDA